MKIRIGQGIDFHRLEKGRKLRLGGINILSDKGCLAHSDGDVLLHAICDALLGAAGLRDIGYYFPDSSNEFKDIDSKILLERTYGLINEKGYRVVNLDCTVCLENPKIESYIPEMKKTIAALLSKEPEDVAIKATTTEKLGFTGREEGIIGIAVVLISRK